MKHWKRVVAAILACVLLVSTIATANAVESVTITLTSDTVDASDAGDTAVIAVEIANNPKIAAANLQINYDTDNLKIETITAEYVNIDSARDDEGQFAKGDMSGGTDSGAVLWARSSGVSQNGVLFWIVFSVKEGAISGDYPVTISQLEDTSTMFADVNRQPVEGVVVNAGTVTVTNGISAEDLMPSVSVTPQGTICYYGDTLPVLTAATEVKVAGELTYEWYYYPVSQYSTPSGTLIENENAATLDTSKYVTDYDSYVFTCVVTNTFRGTDKVNAGGAYVIYKKADQNPPLSIEVDEGGIAYGDDLNEKVAVSGGSTAGQITYVVKNAENETVYEGADLSDCHKLNAGIYTVTATKAGDDNHNASADMVEITVAKVDPNLTVAKNAVSVVKELTADIGATLTGVGSESLTDELAYQSSNTAVATVDANGKITAVGLGTASITVNFAGNDNYNSASATVAVTVTDKLPVEVSFSQPSGTLTYSDSEQSLDTVLTAASLPADFDGTESVVYTVTDSDGNAVCSGTDLSELKITNAGTYTVTATYEDSTNLGSAVVTLVVEKNNQAALNITSGNAVTYGEDLPLTTEGGSTNGTVTYSVENGTGAATVTNGVLTPVKAGTVTLTATMAGNENYNDVSTTLTITINKVKVAVPTAKSGLTYGGGAQVGVEDGDYYTLSGEVSGTNAGSYTATASLDNTDNYEWADGSVADKEIEWTIAQADAKELIKTVSLRYSDTNEQNIIDLIEAQLADAGDITINSAELSATDNVVSLNGTSGFSLVSGLTSADKDKTDTIEVGFSSDNYKDSTLTITVVVMDKVDVSDEITFAGGSLTYNGTVQTWKRASIGESYTGTITYKYSADMKNVGSYTVTAIYEDDNNYGEATATVTITPATLTITGVSVENKEYDGTTAATVTGVTFSGLKGGDELTLGTNYSASGEFAEVGAGTGINVNVIVTLDSNNYTLESATYTGKADITQVPVSVTVDLEFTEATYTGNAIKPAVTVTYNSELLTDYNVTYSKNTNAGTATVKVVSTASSGYAYESEATFEIKPADLTILTANDLSVAYTGEALRGSSVKGVAKFGNMTVSGTWSWVTQPSSTDVGEYTGRVKFNPINASINSDECDINVTITQAIPEVAVSYDSVAVGQTLSDANLTLSTVKVNGVTVEMAGNLAWDDDVSTVIASGKAYGWTFTPEDGNYATVTGEIVLAYAYFGGGGGYVPSVPDYADVKSSDWYYDAVKYVTKNKLMNGTEDGTTFSPSMSVTRGMLMTILARMDKVSTDGGSVWYQKGMEWAVAEGVSDGTNPTGEITREQIVTMLWRYAGKPAVASDHLSAYPDADEVSGWAQDGVNWAVSVGLLNGDENGCLNPTDTASRAELATILMRFMKKIG